MSQSVLFPGIEPDFGRLLSVLRREGEPDRVPFIELFADIEVMPAVLDERPVVTRGSGDDDWTAIERGDRSVWAAMLDQRIRFCRAAAFDYVNVATPIPFTYKTAHTGDTAELTKGERSWIEEGDGVITSVDDFERYRWPRPEEIDYYAFEYVSQNLPEGMKIIATTSGVLEYVMWLMGFQAFSIALYEQPGLVAAMFEQMERLFVPIYEAISSVPEVGAVFLGDDMGFRSGTFIS
ncbi:MAG: hypothetical protein GX620_15670, partial [Chloroflexi bacterium]|nr:hypothetical protein [Chloroflexota bacterium]